MRVVIIGAGLAGLACAQVLAARGHGVTLFDKGRGPGGRMSTRRVSVEGSDVPFDHGAAYLTANHPEFAAELAQWHAQGVVAPWPQAAPGAWTGTPGMNAPVAFLARQHDTQFASHVMGLLREGAHWQILLQDGSRHGPYDAAVLAVPAEQAAAFLGTYDLAMAAHAIAARSQPCWSVMAAFAQRLPIAADALHGGEPVAFAARNSAKPGRAGTEAWVLQASAAWSVRHLEDEAPQVAETLITWLADQAGGTLPACLHLAAHRWRYAMAGRSPQGALWNAGLRLGACGDWLLGPGVEEAWLSGTQLGRRIAA